MLAALGTVFSKLVMRFPLARSLGLFVAVPLLPPTPIVDEFVIDEGLDGGTCGTKGVEFVLGTVLFNIPGFVVSDAELGDDPPPSSPSSLSISPANTVCFCQISFQKACAGPDSTLNVHSEGIARLE
jgi:hypothetical protein